MVAIKILRIIIACPPVHTFCKKFKRYKKERKHEIERQLLVHISTLLNNETYMIAIKSSELSELVHLPTLFAKKLKGTR